jgi:hypothetical protein
MVSLSQPKGRRGRDRLTVGFSRRPILKSASNSQIYGRFSLSQIDVQLYH